MILPGILASGISGHLGGNYTSIATQTVGSGGASSVTFSSIPGTYTHLQIRATVVTGAVGWVTLRFNGDTGNDYSFHELRGDGSSASSSGGASSGDIQAWLHNTTAGSAIVDILDYASPNKNKTARTLGGYDANGSGYIDLTSGLWMNTSAINSITIGSTTSTFSQYTNFSLYGVR